MIPIPENYEMVPWHGCLNYHHADIQPVMLQSLVSRSKWVVFCPECGFTVASALGEVAADLWNLRVTDQGGGPADEPVSDLRQ